MASSPFSWSGEFVIKKPWNDVMRAAQLKYPNPFNPSVLSIDVCSRKFDEKTGVMETIKLINSSWPMFSNAGELRAIERTVVDPSRQYMLLESNNVDMRGVLKATEKLEYEVHPDNKEWTIIKQHVSVDAFRFIAYGALSASQKAAKSGREALVWAIENRVDNFMSRVPTAQSVPSITAAVASTDTEVQKPSTGLSRRFSFPRFRMPSLPVQIPSSPLRALVVAHASTPPPPPPGSTSTLPPIIRRQRTSSISSLPASLERVITSFDTFNPIGALDEFRERLTADVGLLRDRLQRQCQMVATRFSKVDEYVLIM